MAKRSIIIGDYPNDSQGDSLRLAFDKINRNFTELYNTTGADAPANKLVNGANEVVLDTNGNLTFPFGTLSATEMATGFSLTTDGDQALIGASNFVGFETAGGYGQLHMIQDTETDKGRFEIFFQNGPGVLWIFDETDSSLTFPDDTVQTTAWTGSTTVSSLVNSGKTLSLDTDGELALPTNGYTEAVIKELDATALVLFAQKANANIKLLAGATSAGSAKQWLFDGAAGRTMFPNGTVPEHSYGAAGDKEGMVVFSDPYIYYCKTDYVNNTTDIWVRVAWTGTSW